MPRRVQWSKAVLLILLAVVMIALSYYSFREADRRINRGLDIAGGVFVLLEAVEEEGQELDPEAVDRAMEIIRRRVDELGVVEPVIQRQGDWRIRVELPGYEDEREARDIIGRTAMLRFVDPDGEEIITGEHLRSARASREAVRGMIEEPVVILELDSEGRQRFSDATARLAPGHEPISIYLDDELIYSPGVQDHITGGEALITGLGSMEEASEIAFLLRSGALPVSLEEREIFMIGPTLGEEMEDIGVAAAALGFLAVVLFLILYYRATGILAGIILCFYLGLLLAAIMVLGATLTLPGIAGIILSIGMAVDANIIIFERIKEELRSGRALRVSIEAGFDRAFRTILDANVTTIIAAVALFALADGPVRGFAVTLIIGLVCSMFTALVVSRYLLRLAYRSGVWRSGAFLGVRS